MTESRQYNAATDFVDRHLQEGRDVIVSRL